MLPYQPAILMAAVASGAALQKRADEAWQVTRFSAYVAAHSITQIITFSVTLPGSEEALQCSAATGAVLSSSPYLLAVTNGKCIDGSGLTFNFTQVEDFAIRLDVENEQGCQATHTSDPNSVSYIKTGSTPLDTMTAYTGPQDFALAVVA